MRWCDELWGGAQEEDNLLVGTCTTESKQQWNKVAPTHANGPRRFLSRNRIWPVCRFKKEDNTLTL